MYIGNKIFWSVMPWSIVKISSRCFGTRQAHMLPLDLISERLNVVSMAMPCKWEFKFLGQIINVPVGVIE